MSSASDALGLSLRTLVIRNSGLESAGFVVRNCLRLGGHLIMARLLFPEAFGLMALVALALSALQLLSDLGLNACVIQNERGDDKEFLNTAWTLQAIRGLLLWLVAIVAAAPLASFYAEPQLAMLIPFAGLSVLIAGFNSTSLISARRHLKVGVVVLVDIAEGLVSICVMLAWALVTPSVWALVVGGVAGAITKLITSHLVAGRSRDRFGWDAAAASAMFHFGKWIFLSTGIYFVSQQLDRALLGRLVGLDLLGVYSVAVMLAATFHELVVRLSHGVVFPALSRARRAQRAALSAAYYQVRLLLDCFFLPVLGALAILGSAIVSLLYDQRYAEAGWMLELFAVRVALSCILTQCETCLVALGQPRYSYWRNIVRAVWIAVTVPVGWSVSGIAGVVWAVSLSEIPVLLVLWTGASRHGILWLNREFVSLGLFLSGLAIAWLLEALLPVL